MKRLQKKNKTKTATATVFTELFTNMYAVKEKCKNVPVKLCSIEINP